ncbi:MAG: hypothetical protein WBH45_14175, partial [Acidobacteriaceae bacterium]
TYGPRLIQLGISLLRGYAVPPYNYVRHKVVTPETLAGETSTGAIAAPRHDGEHAPPDRRAPASREARRSSDREAERARLSSVRTDLPPRQ